MCGTSSVDCVVGFVLCLLKSCWSWGSKLIGLWLVAEFVYSMGFDSFAFLSWFISTGHRLLEGCLVTVLRMESALALIWSRLVLSVQYWPPAACICPRDNRLIGRSGATSVTFMLLVCGR